jgi:hypothetical protein
VAAASPIVAVGVASPGASAVVAGSVAVAAADSVAAAVRSEAVAPRGAGSRMNIVRMAKHLVSEGAARRRFPESALDAIQKAIATGEARHRGQVCFAIEGALPLGELLRDRTARARAQEMFAHLRVWDTEHNSGVLIYVLIADHAIEIVADRGIHARVAESEWLAVCAQLRERFVAGDFESGAIAAVVAVSAILAQHFPSDGTPVANELPDRPVRL